MVSIDKFYVIHCIENKERLYNIEYQKQHNKLLNDKLEIYWTCYFPFSDVASNALLLSNKSRYISNKSEYNLCREFYRIIKLAYESGLNSICIFEDDFSVINEEEFNKFFDLIPEDFDIIQLSYLFSKDMGDYNKLFNEYKSGNLWMKKTFGAWSNNGIILSRNGMKYFIDSINKEFQAADIPIHESKNNMRYYGKTNQAKLLNHYIPTYPIVYVDGIDSTVQNSNDKSKKLIYELYSKYIDKTKYNMYKKEEA